MEHYLSVAWGLGTPADDKNALKRNNPKLMETKLNKDYYYFMWCSGNALPIWWHRDKNQKVAEEW